MRDCLRPRSDLEKVQISSANWMDRMGVSIRDGGSHSGVKESTRSAMKRLKRSGDRGSPCRRPTFVVNG